MTDKSGTSSHFRRDTNVAGRRVEFAVPWVVFTVGLMTIVLLPFRDIFPLQNDFVTQAFTGDYAKVPAADFMFVSYMFQHENIWHLGWNLLFLWWLGSILENAVGHWRTAVFLAATAIGAGLVHYFADPFLHIPVIGLSGVIYAMLTVMALSMPWHGLRSLPPLPLWILALVLIGLQIWGFSNSLPSDKTAYWIHFGGIGSGFALWAFWLRKHINAFKATEFGAKFLN